MWRTRIRAGGIKAIIGAGFGPGFRRKVDPTADLQVTTTVLTFDRGYQKVEGSACDEFGTIGSLWGGRHGTQCAFNRPLSRNQPK